MASAVGAQAGLLVLDTCEHLPTAAAHVASAVLHAAPDVHLLATSRRPLGLLLRGRCRNCGERISLEYPAVELLTAGLFALAPVRLPVGQAAIVAPFSGVLLAAALIDVRHKIIPNRLVYPAIPLFAAAILTTDAKAEDALALAEEIRERVKREHGIDLEYEVELWSSK